MYLTINRFRVKPGQEDAFEAMWVSRDSHLKSVEGFVSFHLMKGEEKDGHRLYLSHTLWRDRAAFEGWTKSEAFRQAHKGAKSSGEMYDGPPELEVFETISGTMATNSCLCIRSSKSSSFRSQRPDQSLAHQLNHPPIGLGHVLHNAQSDLEEDDEPTDTPSKG